MANLLIEIPFQSWPNLCDLYVNRKCYSSAYNLLKYYIKKLTQNPNLDVKIYALNGDWQQDGTFIMKDGDYVFINTLTDNLERLMTAINCLDANQKYQFSGFSERLLPALEQYFDLTECKEFFNPVGTYWHYATAAQINEFQNEIPDGISIKRLTDDDAQEVFDVWPFRGNNSIDFVKQLIDCDDSVGAFDNDGNLIAWCLILPIGSLGLLQVTETHKRKGLGNLMVRHLSKIMSAKNIEVTAPVVFDNIASRTMFEKLGFSVIDKVYWVTKPLTDKN